jgi:uncharacterized protein
MAFLEESNEPVTVIVSRLVQPEREQDFEALLAAMTQEAQNFPGYLGANIIRPSSKTGREYILIFRFNSYANLMRWEESSVRQAWLKRADEMAASPLSLRKTPGLEFWFTPQQSVAPTPPRYKMAIVLTLVIFGLSVGLAPLLKRLLIGLSPLLSQLIIVAIQVILITYLILPFLTKLLARWLFATRSSKSRSPK